MLEYEFLSEYKSLLLTLPCEETSIMKTKKGINMTVYPKIAKLGSPGGKGSWLQVLLRMKSGGPGFRGREACEGDREGKGAE